MRRNLVYHCYPVAASPMWRWNLKQLRARLPLFDGVRVVALALDATTAPAAEVKACLPGVEWVELENDPRVSETASWVRLWEAVRGEPGVTFRAHAKGVTPYEKQQTVKLRGSYSNHFGEQTSSHVVEVSWKPVPTPPTRTEAMRLWAQVMYEANLDYWPLAERALAGRPMCGVLKQAIKTSVNSWLPVRLWPAWQYLGSYYWVRNEDFFARDWRSIPANYYGVELWPGFAFDTREAACLFWTNYGRMTPMNRVEFMRGTVLRKFEGWKRHHAGSRHEVVHLL